GRKGDCGADGWSRDSGAAAVPLRPRGAAGNPLGVAGHPVADEGIGEAVRIARHEVRGVAPEGDEATVGRKGGTETLDVDRVRQRPRGVQARPFGDVRPGRPRGKEQDGAESAPSYAPH